MATLEINKAAKRPIPVEQEWIELKTAQEIWDYLQSGKAVKREKIDDYGSLASYECYGLDDDLESIQKRLHFGWKFYGALYHIQWCVVTYIRKMEHEKYSDRVVVSQFSKPSKWKDLNFTKIVNRIFLTIDPRKTYVSSNL